MIVFGQLEAQVYMSMEQIDMMAGDQALSLIELVRKNPRGSRRIYRGIYGRRDAFIKVYAGLSAAYKAKRGAAKGRRLRRCFEQAPALLYVGKVPGLGWVLVYQAIMNGQTLSWLRCAEQPQEGLPMVEKLVLLFATLHDHGIRQHDTNLTNFMFSGDTLYLLDDDDLSFAAAPLGLLAAQENLASVLARLLWLTDAQLCHMLVLYMASRGFAVVSQEQEKAFLRTTHLQRAARLRKHQKKGA